MHPYLHISQLKIPTYGLCLAFAVVLCSFLIYRSLKKDKSITKEAVPPEYLLVILAVCILSFVFGANLLYILVTYNFSYLLEKIKNLDFSFTKQMGMVFYGGLISGIFGALVAAKCTKINLLSLEKHIVPYVPLGHAIGRLGCLLGGCCYGMKYDGFCAVYYKTPIVASLSPNTGYFPVQPMESILDLCIMAILFIYAKKQRRRGNILSLYLLLYAIMRFTTEIFRGDAARGLFSGISTSQWISIGLAAFFFIRIIYLKISSKKVI